MTAKTKIKMRNAKLRYYAAAALIVLAIIGSIIIGRGVRQYAPAKQEGALQHAPAELEAVKPAQRDDNKSLTTVPKGKIIQPAPQHKIEQLRKGLGLPERGEEEKDTKRQLEEILKKHPNARFIF